MSDHLPECPNHDYGIGCICDRLRACEQRVRRDGISAVVAAQANSYRQGLDAARDAVAALPLTPDDLTWHDALAAIDALRGES